MGDGELYYVVCRGDLSAGLSFEEAKRVAKVRTEKHVGDGWVVMRKCYECFPLTRFHEKEYGK